MTDAPRLTPLPEIRRIVTGHDPDGRARVMSDGALPHVIRPPAQDGLAFHEIWHTAHMPGPIGFEAPEPTDSYRDTAPPPGGTIIRVVDIPPEGQDGPDFDRDAAEALFDTVGLGENAKHTIPGRHPLMHRTASVDYGICMMGEVVLLLDDEEVVLGPGDVVIQRGTIHAWTNRTDSIARMLFILTDATIGEDLAKAQAAHDAKVAAEAGEA